MLKNIKLTVIRHGETEWNIIKKLQGQANSPLTSLGVEQASFVGKALENERFDAFYSSDLERCIKTSSVINDFLDMDVQYFEGLRERNFGVLQGLYREEIQQKFPNIFLSLEKGNINFDVEKGESFKVFYERINQTFTKIVSNGDFKNILVVTHGGALDCLIRKVFKLSLDAPRTFSIFNTSINRFTVTDYWKLDTWGDINHLKSITTIDDF